MSKITFTISEDKFEEFKEGFLKCQPTPKDMTDNEWIKEWGKQQYIRVYRIGKQQIAREHAIIDENIVG